MYLNVGRVHTNTPVYGIPTKRQLTICRNTSALYVQQSETWLKPAGRFRGKKKKKRQREGKGGSKRYRNRGVVTYQKCIHCLSTVHWVAGGRKDRAGSEGLEGCGGPGPQPLCTQQSQELSWSLQGSPVGHYKHITPS